MRGRFLSQQMSIDLIKKRPMGYAALQELWQGQVKLQSGQGGNSDRVGLQSGPPFSLDADELVGGLRFLRFLQLHVFTVALQCDLTWFSD